MVAVQIEIPQPPMDPPSVISALDAQLFSEFDIVRMMEHIDDIRALFHPAVFKFGITRDLRHRYFNRAYGYFLLGYNHMQALHVGEPGQAQFIERSLISIYSERGYDIAGCRNIAPGGERPPPEGIETYTYIVVANGAHDIINVNFDRTRRARWNDPRVIDACFIPVEEISDDEMIVVDSDES